MQFDLTFKTQLFFPKKCVAIPNIFYKKTLKIIQEFHQFCGFFANDLIFFCKYWSDFENKKTTEKEI